MSDENQSPISTRFYSPVASEYEFKDFYQRLKNQGFVNCPAKISNADTFRIGNISDIYLEDIERLIAVVESDRFW